MFELKRLSTAAIPAALAKAERYRLLNEPEEAQSICEDVLTADADNFEAVRMLILALTDSFPNHDPNNVSRAQELVARLPSEYERAYFSGLVAERRARALLTRGGPGRALPAGDLLREAMRAFERAEAREARGQRRCTVALECVRAATPALPRAGGDRRRTHRRR